METAPSRASWPITDSRRTLGSTASVERTADVLVEAARKFFSSNERPPQVLLLGLTPTRKLNLDNGFQGDGPRGRAREGEELDNISSIDLQWPMNS